MVDMSKTQMRRVISSYVGMRNRTHYLKWPLTKEWSIRYYKQYETKSKYVNKWVLKSHFKKEYIILTAAEALDYIMKYAKNMIPEEFFSVIENNGNYRRILLHPTKGIECYTE